MKWRKAEVKGANDVPFVRRIFAFIAIQNIDGIDGACQAWTEGAPIPGSLYLAPGAGPSRPRLIVSATIVRVRVLNILLPNKGRTQ